MGPACPQCGEGTNWLFEEDFENLCYDYIERIYCTYFQCPACESRFMEEAKVSFKPINEAKLQEAEKRILQPHNS